jgi:hypothetical protein
MPDLGGGWVTQSRNTILQNTKSLEVKVRPLRVERVKWILGDSECGKIAGDEREREREKEREREREKERKRERERERERILPIFLFLQEQIKDIIEREKELY